jgi:RNA polymerase sigma-70 factor, ECF subfamily
MATLTWNAIAPGTDLMVSTSEPQPSEFAGHEPTLVTRACNGDTEAFYALVHPCERMIYFTALSILRNEADAEEVAQEAILKAFKALPGFRAQSKFSTWLTQIAVNEAKMKMRKDRRHLYKPIEDDHDEWQPQREIRDWREIPSEWLERSELRAALQKALMSLDTKYRNVMLLRDVEHVSIADTAEILGITCECVKTRLCRARLQMREALAEWRQSAAIGY